MFANGISARSQCRADPVLHVIVRDGNGWGLWCSGAKALYENTLTGRRCPTCMALARADLRENGVAPDERSGFDWYLGRTPTRASGS